MSVVVIGSLNMDLVIRTDKMPKIGETLNGSNFVTACGGKGANQAVAVSKLKSDVTMIGNVGRDEFGKRLIKTMTSYGVNVDCIKQVDTSTGVAMIVVANTDNFIILDNGANYTLDESAIESLEDEIKKHKIMILQLEVKLEVVKKSMEIAKRHGIKVILNPAPAIKLPNDLLSGVDILILNETEIETLLGKEMLSFEDYKNGVKELEEKGIESVILTLGSKGVIFNSRGTVCAKEAYRVNAVDTTSAGDSFIGGFVSKVLTGENIENSIEYAMAVAAVTVTRNGAMDSIPTREEVADFLKNLS